jgi:hypothetical protein
LGVSVRIFYVNPDSGRKFYLDETLCHVHTADARVKFLGNAYGLCGGPTWRWDRFLSKHLGFSLPITIPLALYSSIIQICYNRPIGASPKISFCFFYDAINNSESRILSSPHG